MKISAANWTKLVLVFALVCFGAGCSKNKSKADTTPDAFTLSTSSATTAVDFGAPFEATTTITGINKPASISVTGGQYKIGAGAYTSAAGTVKAGDVVTVKVNASNAALTAATATLTVGGTTATFKVTTKADTVVPTVAITTPANAATVAGVNVTVTGTSADDRSGVASVTVKINSGAEQPATLTPATGAWTASLPLVIGTNTVTVYSTDAAGNKSANQTLTLTKLDDLAPTVAITTPANAATVTGANVTVSGTATDANSGVASVTVKINTGAEIAATLTPATGAWTASLPLTIGSNTITVYGTDVQGNKSANQSIVVTKEDDVPPTAAIKFPPPTSMTEGATVFVRGEADDEHSAIKSVTVNGQAATLVTVADGPDTWSLDNVALAVGDNTVTVVVTDAKDNTKETTVEILRTNDLTQAFPNNDVPFIAPYYVDANLTDSNPSIYVSELSGSIVKIDLNTGERQVISDNTSPRESDFHLLNGISVGSNNKLYAVDSDVIHVIDLATNERTNLATKDDLGSLISIPNGVRYELGFLYVADDEQIYSVDSTGSQTLVTRGESGNPFGAGIPFENQISDLAIDASNSVLYVIDSQGGKSVYKVGIETGDRLAIAELDTNVLSGIAFDGKRNKLIVTSDLDQKIFVLDVASPEASPVVYDNSSFGGVNQLSTPWSLAIKESSGYALIVDRGVLSLIAMDLESGNRVIISKSDTASD